MLDEDQRAHPRSRLVAGAEIDVAPWLQRPMIRKDVDLFQLPDDLYRIPHTGQAVGIVHQEVRYQQDRLGSIVVYQLHYRLQIPRSESDLHDAIVVDNARIEGIVYRCLLHDLSEVSQMPSNVRMQGNVVVDDLRLTIHTMELLWLDQSFLEQLSEFPLYALTVTVEVGSTHRPVLLIQRKTLLKVLPVRQNDGLPAGLNLLGVIPLGVAEVSGCVLFHIVFTQ